MESTSNHHFGIVVALVLGVMTVVAATIVVATKGKQTEPQGFDFSDNWDEILGI